MVVSEDHTIDPSKENTGSSRQGAHEAEEIPGGGEVASLSRELAAEKEKNKELYDKHLRLLAEFENFKKRMEREKCEYYKYALERLVKDLLPVFDHLELAIKAAEGSDDFKGFSEGVKLIHKQFKDVLEKEGLRYECAVGEPFDPCKHEAMLHLETEAHEPNMVMEEHKKGYFLNDRLIRPAMVTVAKRPEERKTPKGGHDQQQ